MAVRVGEWPVLRVNSDFPLLPMLPKPARHSLIKAAIRHVLSRFIFLPW